MMRWLAALWLLLAAGPALADELRPAVIQFEQVSEGAWRLGWRQPVASQADARATLPELPANCHVVGEIRRDVVQLAVVGEAQVACTGPVAGQSIGWPELIGQSDAILRVAPLDRPLQVFRLTSESPLATIAARPSSWQVWQSYFVIGIDHILAGWDHLLFVIALVLLVARPWPVVKAATAFTLAHSLTLAAVTLGFAGIRQDVVEALIALSIVFLAVEIARGRRDTVTQRLPWLVAFAFGLLHGFGFAGALAEVGLPPQAVPLALVFFNVGVELGQIAFIIAMLALGWILSRLLSSGTTERGEILATYLVGSLAAFWLLERVAAF